MQEQIPQQQSYFNSINNKNGKNINKKEHTNI